MKRIDGNNVPKKHNLIRFICKAYYDLNAVSILLLEFPAWTDLALPLLFYTGKIFVLMFEPAFPQNRDSFYKSVSAL